MHQCNETEVHAHYYIQILSWILSWSEAQGSWKGGALTPYLRHYTQPAKPPDAAPPSPSFATEIYKCHIEAKKSLKFVTDTSAMTRAIPPTRHRCVPLI